MGYVNLRRRREVQARHRRWRPGFWEDVAGGSYLAPVAAVLLLVVGLGIGIPSLIASLSPPGLAEFFIVAAALLPAAACIWGGGKLFLAWSRKNASDTPGRWGAEKQLLLALRDAGALTPVEAALETSLTVDEAEEILTRFADRGHLVVESRDGALAYTLPGRRQIPDSWTV